MGTTSGPGFSASVVDTVSKRAALLCSNPECRKLTVGPNSDDTKLTNIGEAAHIFGARPNSARYRPEMTDMERATISNAIWLCRDCHGLVDRDALRFPADMLLLWRQHHEDRNLRELGKPGDLVILQMVEQQRSEFVGVPAFCHQILRERPKFWEFFFAAELLDHQLRPSLSHARHLIRGLVAGSHYRLAEDECVGWAQRVMSEFRELTETLNRILAELVEAFGLPGQPGDARQIADAVQLFARCADQMLKVAEEASFARAPEGYEELIDCMAELTSYAVAQLETLSRFFRSIPAEEPSPQRSYYLTIEAVPLETRALMQEETGLRSALEDIDREMMASRMERRERGFLERRAIDGPYFEHTEPHAVTDSRTTDEE